MASTPKHHDSCVRVLEFLKLLILNDIDLKDIFNFDNKLFQDIFAQETFLKYISTLEISGFGISKIGKKYSLNNSINRLDLDKSELQALIKIYESFDFSCIENQREYINSFFAKIKKLLPEEIKKEFENNINQFKNRENSIASRSNYYQKYVDLEQKIKITYNGETITVDPKKVEINDNTIYLIVYNPKTAEIIKLLTDKISSIETLPLKSSSYNMTSSVVFEVYEGLIDNYRLRECEYLQSFDKTKKVIVNKGEDRIQLLKRLMKYGENCKIISPKSFKEQYLAELEKIEEKLQGVSK
jgi:predicted DNA-binding transcriptional regulator YafY